jgi:hypothetical protein
MGASVIAVDIVVPHDTELKPCICGNKDNASACNESQLYMICYSLDISLYEHAPLYSDV